MRYLSLFCIIKIGVYKLPNTTLAVNDLRLSANLHVHDYIILSLQQVSQKYVFRHFLLFMLDHVAIVLLTTDDVIHFRFLQAECDQKCGVHLQIWACVWDGHVHATEMSGVPVEEVSRGGHEARVRGTRNPVCAKTERKESPERKRQTTSEHNDSRRPHAANHAVWSTASGGSEDCKLSQCF